MKALSLVLGLLVGLMALSASAWAEPEAKEKIVVVADSWCPFNCEPGAEKPGILIEIAQRAFSRHNIALEYKIVPWERALAGTLAGTYNAAVGASPGDEPRLIFPKNQQAVSKMGFFVKVDSPWNFTDLGSLGTISLGAISGYSYGEPVDSYIAQNINNMARVQVVSGDNALDLNIQKLLKGRIGAFIESDAVAKYVLSTHEAKDKIRTAGYLPLSEGSNLFLGFSPKLNSSARYAEILSQETKNMMKSGEMKTILERYGLNDG